MVAAPHLRIVKEPEVAGASAEPARGREDTVLVGALFLLNLVPVVGELVHPGGWSPGIVGFAAAAALLTGRELWSQLRAAPVEKSEGVNP